MKKAATKKTTKKKDLNSMDYSDGKVRTLDDIKKLEELLDIPRANPYGTLDLEVFKKKVETMSLNEMSNLASRVGVQQTNRQNVLRERLVVSCDSYLRRHRANIGGVDITTAKRDDAVYNEIQDLLKFPKRGSK
jgi:hypothetical protein